MTLAILRQYAKVVLNRTQNHFYNFKIAFIQKMINEHFNGARLGRAVFTSLIFGVSAIEEQNKFKCSRLVTATWHGNCAGYKFCGLIYDFYYLKKNFFKN